MQKSQMQINIMPPIGCALLLLVLFDAIASLIPPQFFNATWEFNTIGNLVNRVPLILIGFGAIFWGAREIKNSTDRLIWQGLRWLTLAIAIFFLLLAPLLVVNSFRIKKQTDAAIATEVTQKLTNLDRLEIKVNQGNPVDLKNTLLQATRRQDLEDLSPQAVKDRLLKEITTEKQTAREKIENRIQPNQLELVRNTVKWFLGSIVGASLLFLIWRYTV